MDWFTEVTRHPGVMLGVIMVLHLLVMEWSWLKSCVFALIYHTIFLLGMAYDPERVFAPELAADSRWLLVQTVVLVWVIAVLLGVRHLSQSQPFSIDQDK